METILQRIKVERYPAYKDSGVEWLGEVPEGWEVIKLKYAAELISVKISSKNSPHKYIGMENIESWTGNFVSSETEVEGLASYFKSGDVLFGKLRPYLAKVYLAPNEGICSTEFLVYRAKDHVYSKYLKMLMLSHGFIHLIDSSTYGSKMPRANPDFIETQVIPIPPLPEQTRIAAFLDRKTARIDQAIAQKERLIELLKERRQILIQNAVTRGLNPDVKMKDSGVEWIGEVPEHWEVKRIKNIFQLIIDPAPNNNNLELLSIYTDIGVKPRKDLEEKGNRASTTDGYWHVKKGDFIVNKLLAWMGAIGLSYYNGVTSPAYDILRPKAKLSGEYFHALFRLSIFSSELKKHSRGIMEMRLRLYFDKFGAVEVPFPPIEEQAQIAAYIETITQKISTAIAAKQSEIEKLREYKAVLIDAAVTGKVRV